MKNLFYKYIDDLNAALTGDEVLLGCYDGEQSDFVRFNRSLIRQPGSVTQKEMSLRLIDGQRHISSSTTLTGAPDIESLRRAQSGAGGAGGGPGGPGDPGGGDPPNTGATRPKGGGGS